MTDEKKFVTESGIPVKPYYTPDDLKDWDYHHFLGYPGKFPYTRGVYETMYRGKLWTMRLYSGLATAEESNKRYKYLLSQGQTGLSVALDLPTQLGYDSDNAMVEDEVGRIGVAIDTLADMESLFDGIDLGKISTSFTINSTAIIILAMYVATAIKQGVPMNQISGTTQNDMVKEFLARNTYIFPMEDSLRISVDIIEYCAKNIPKWNPINIAGYHIRESGADSVQELGILMKTAIFIVEETLKRGIDIDSFAPRLSFELWTGNDFFEEIAKYRAARRMWAKIMKEKFGAKNPKSMLFRVFAGGNGITLTAQEPLNNIIRVTMQCLASALGGAQAIHAPAYDEAIATPTQESALLALRTQQILAYESGIAKTVDPLAGSYYVELLTNELEERAWKYMEEIDAQGGLIKAISSGAIQREVQKRAYEEERKIQSVEKIVVGVNKYTDENSGNVDIPIYQADDSVLKKQKARLNEVKRMRDAVKVASTLAEVRKAAKNKENLFPSILEAVQSYATVGEIAGVLKEEIGEYTEPPIF
jgi:methylmalonyl-CoA mutase N-terminal domain/subunit